MGCQMELEMLLFHIKRKHPEVSFLWLKEFYRANYETWCNYLSRLRFMHKVWTKEKYIEGEAK